MRKVNFMCLTPIWLESKKIYVPCGHCKACLLKSTYDWAHRIILEAAQYDRNCVVTLTYNDEHMPENRLLNYYDVQCFLKRLRKRIAPDTVRFFCSCEYGDKFERPHYHCILFNYYPPDCEYMFSRHGNKFYKSEFMNEVWHNGFATVGTLTEKSAFYCAKYLQKLNFSDMPKKPCVHMSLKPAIGACAYTPKMHYSKKLYVGGKACPLPRYYLKKLKQDFPDYYNDDYQAEVMINMRHQHDGVSSVDDLRSRQVNENFRKKFTLNS